MTPTLFAIAALVLALLVAWPMGLHTTAAQPGLGTQLKYSTTQAGTYNLVALRTSIEGPEPEKQKVDKTTLDSIIKEFRDSGLPDLGELVLNIWWDPGDTVHQLLETWATGASPTVWWHVIFQDAKQTTAEFSGWVSKFGKSGMEPESNLAGAATIVLTSVPLYTYGNPTG